MTSSSPTALGPRACVSSSLIASKSCSSDFKFQLSAFGSFFLLAVICGLFLDTTAWGQTSTQNFGTTTGSNTSQTGSTTLIPNPTSGTTYARAGAVAPAAPVALVTASNPLPTTGAYLKAVASSSTSVTKFSPWVSYTSSTEFYTSFKVLFGDNSAGNTATSGIWTFFQGAGANYSDNNDGSSAQVFTGLRFTYGASGALTLTYNNNSTYNSTSLTTSAFSQGSVYTVEIVGNNKTSGTISYAYNGVAQTVAVQKFDLYINGAKVGDDLAKGTISANTAINAGTFTGVSSTSNAANIFVDDAVTYNAVPSTIGTPGGTISGAATASAFTTTYGTSSAAQTFSVSGTGLTAGILATAPTGFEVASDGTTYGGTATFTQSGGGVTGTLSLRLKATAAVSGSYNSQNIVLSSTGATSVNIVTASSGNAVTTKTLAITASDQSKTYGSALTLGTSLFTSSGLENSESIGSVTLTSSGATATAAAASYTITPSAATGGTFTAGNYSITYNTGTLTVNQKALTITANDITKPYGDALANPVTGSTAFASSGLASSETIGSVTITYGTGAAAGDAAGSYSNAVVPSLAVGGSFTISNYSVTYVSGTLTVSADPTITVNGSLSAVNTTYGTASASPASFSVSGIFLTGDLTVTPPGGFEVSTSIGSGYTTSLTIPASGTLGSTPVYVRLAAATAFGTYSGNVTLSGGGAISKTVATAPSSVAKKSLTITSVTGNSKIYDHTTAATLAGTPAYSGLENGETFSVSGTASALFANASVGVGKTITVTGFTAPSANYSVAQPTGLIGDISSLALTVTGAAVTAKVYSGTATATITGAALVGVISPDTVTIATSTGTFADANTGVAISVTAALTLGGANAANYSLTQPTGLAGDITKASQTITFAALSDKLTTDSPFTLAATGGASGQPVTFAANPPSSVVTISGNTVTIVGAGTTTITASQAGNGNYNAATDVARTLTVTTPSLATWPGPWSGTATSSLAATTKDSNLSSASLARVGLAGSSSSARYSSSGWNTTANYMTASLSAAFGYLINLNGAVITGTWGSSGTGPANFDLRSSVDNYSTSLGTFNSSTGTVTTSITLPGSGYNSLSTVTFRMIGSATAASSGATASAGTGGPASLIFYGVVVAAPSITGGATASDFTTIYGSPSAEQSFNVGGSNLITNLVATAPSGFEVSADGTTYGSSATFAPSNGLASGSLRIRFAAAATVSGTYNSQSIVLSSTGAASVNIITTSSGNTVSKATPTITSSPSASTITYGQTLAASSLSEGSASVDGLFTFTAPGTVSSVGTSSQSITFIPTDTANYNSAATTTNVLINPKPLAITADGKTKVKGKADPALTYTSSGLVGGDTISGSLSRDAGEAIGSYAITQGTLSVSSNYSISFTGATLSITSGFLAGDDTVTRQPDSSGFKIPVATLLANDGEVASDGSLDSSGLVITGVTGTTVSLSGAFIFYTPADPSANSPVTFTYTASNGISTDTGTVTVSTTTAAKFTLDLIRVVTPAAFAAGETSVTVEFAGVPSQTYKIEYSTDMNNWSDPPLSISTGSTGTFNATFIKSGDQTSAWSSLFFRAFR